MRGLNAALITFLAISTLASCATGGSSPKKLSKEERIALYVEMGNASLMEGDATGALQNFLQANQEDDRIPALHHSMALAYYVKHDLADAIKQARQAVELEPKYSDANNTLGKLLMDEGKSAEAIGPLTLAANDILYRDAYKPLTSLGIIYYRRGDYRKSRDALDRAILASPVGACVAYYYRGHLNLRESMVIKAVRDYERASEKLCANFQDAHLALGMAYEVEKRPDLARKKFLQIEKQFPNSNVAEQAMTHLRYLP